MSQITIGFETRLISWIFLFVIFISFSHCQQYRAYNPISNIFGNIFGSQPQQHRIILSDNNGNNDSINNNNNGANPKAPPLQPSHHHHLHHPKALKSRNNPSANNRGRPHGLGGNVPPPGRPPPLGLSHHQVRPSPQNTNTNNKARKQPPSSSNGSNLRRPRPPQLRNRPPAPPRIILRPISQPGGSIRSHHHPLPTTLNAAEHPPSPPANVNKPTILSNFEDTVPVDIPMTDHLNPFYEIRNQDFRTTEESVSTTGATTATTTTTEAPIETTTTVLESTSSEAEETKKSLSLNFTVSPRGHSGPVIISQIPVKSVQTSKALIKEPMPETKRNTLESLSAVEDPRPSNEHHSIDKNEPRSFEVKEPRHLFRDASPEINSVESQRRIDEIKESVDCGGSDLGFCDMSSRYPGHMMGNLMSDCRELVYRGFVPVPEDLDELGEDYSIEKYSNSSKSSVRAKLGNWSWKPYKYKKKQICDSEPRFIRPGYALDSTGKWQVIVQTSDLPQRVAIDLCHYPNKPCQFMSDCGRKSRCIQRYGFQHLLAVDPENLHNCPTIRAFKFPSACVCHVEYKDEMEYMFA